MMDDEAIHEMFEPLGAVTVRRLFGGKGIYRNGLIFALDLFEEIMLKGDGVTAPTYEAAGARRWIYTNSKGTSVAMPYWTVPAEIMDEPERLSAWSWLAYESAMRAERKALSAVRPEPRSS